MKNLKAFLRKIYYVEIMMLGWNGTEIVRYPFELPRHRLYWTLFVIEFKILKARVVEIFREEV